MSPNHDVNATPRRPTPDIEPVLREIQSPTPEKRVRRAPRHLVDFLPSDPRPLQQFSEAYSRLDEFRQNKRRRVEHEQDEPLNPPIAPLQADPLETEPNEMGLFRRYQVPPSRDPDEELTIHHVADAPTFIRESAAADASDPLAGFGPTAREVTEQTTASSRPFFPFLNISVFRLMTWFYASKQLTLATLDRLVYSVILAPGFKQEHFDDFGAARENKRLDDLHAAESNDGHGSALPTWLSGDKWRKGSVYIPLPFKRKSYQSEKDAPTLKVDFYHRDLVEAFTSGVRDFAAKNFHWRGFRQYWKPSESEPEQRVYGEAYTSDALLDLEESITPVEGCTLETAVVPLMLYSDSTHLANFGTASLWPLYWWFGGLSKYIRCKAGCFSAHHLAYLPSLPDTVKDKYIELFGAPPTSAILTFLRRELIHAVWKYLLTDEFKKIYKEGIVLECGDGIWRRLYPRFFLYSADYKERVLLAGIKDIGTWLCVTCRTTISQVLRLGTKLHDFTWSSKIRTDSVSQQSNIRKARRKIFKKGYVVNGKPIDNVLGESLVPVENAFSQLLLPHGQNYFDLFVHDLMHEFELGVWRSVFTHLIRMLYTLGADSVAELDHRYRRVPPFGRSTICRFRNDVSAMKSLAARDFEDLVQ
ncbi:hypothetical protein DXG01_006243, partial [Tephrocybe rancida]